MRGNQINYYSYVGDLWNPSSLLSRVFTSSHLYKHRFINIYCYSILTDICLFLVCLNGPSDLLKYWSEVKYETPFRYVHAEIRTQMVDICDTMRYQLDQGGAHTLNIC